MLFCEVRFYSIAEALILGPKNSAFTLIRIASYFANSHSIREWRHYLTASKIGPPLFDPDHNENIFFNYSSFDFPFSISSYIASVAVPFLLQFSLCMRVLHFVCIKYDWKYAHGDLCILYVLGIQQT